MINKMEIRFAAISENEALARVAVSQFIAKKNPSLEVLGEIKTIVSEGVSNAIIHGYKYDENKEVVIKCLLDGDELRLQIIDFGDGIEDIEKARTPHYTTRPDLERAGMGLTIMDTLSDGFCISSIVGMGTKLTIRKSLLTIKEDELNAQREAL